MKKKLIVFVFLVAIILVIVNGYKWKTTGNQNITITTAKTAYSNSNLYVSIVTDGKGITNTNQEKIKLKLLNSKGHKVKNVDVSYIDDGYTGIIKIPDVEAGNYTIEAYVSSNKGKDTVQKDIYISDGKQENITITLDKGIYKPGDTVNFRALLTDNINDEPIEKDTNVAIYDGNDNKVYNENVTTSEYGILSGKFVIADEVNSGIYKIVVKTNTREFTKEFKVNPYITPKYEINIETDKTKYQIGENVKININSKYFFGEAVSGAKYTVYINGEMYQSPVADENGNATVTYHNVKNVGKYTVKVEAVDSSNYFVEKTSEFTVSSGAFEIQFIPEFGSLLKGQKNKIYVFTKTADGLPVKMYVTVYSNGQTKQIATDENGIGMFEYSSDENAKNVQFQVTAENMQGEKIEKKISLTQISTYTMISTDKVKYNQGEDIKININQTTFGTKNIIMMKNNRIIKQITTDSNEISVKLNDIYGLVDIYVTDAKSNIQKYNQEIFYMTNNTSSLSSDYKRTIFVKPNKALNIDINTDKQEYKPGDDIKISFKTADENGNNIDTALLVSMLDNSILNLADNDLSIDNIKLALQGISFTDDLDAASLYAYIIDDTDEQAMMGLLLRQGTGNPNISTTTTTNDEEEYKAEVLTMLGASLIGFIVIYILYAKFDKLKVIIRHVANILVLAVTLWIFLDSIAYYGFDMSNIFEFMFASKEALMTIISGILFLLIAYFALIYRINKKIYSTSFAVIITTILIMNFIGIYEAFELEFNWLWLITFASLMLLFVIVARINEIKKLKCDKLIRKVSQKIEYICKFALIVAVSFFVGSIMEFTQMGVIAGVLCLYALNYVFNIKENTKKNQRTTMYYVLLILGLILGIFVAGMGIMLVYNSAGRLTEEAQATMDKSAVDFTTAVGSSKNESIFEKSPSSNQEETIDNTEKVIDDNIRNVFLESMCFVPELVTSNGQAELDLKLSDNITTWTIQTVGNTKNGRVGYATLDNVKVFKEFFVDYELPQNLVVGDKVSIPVTIFNYTDSKIETTIKISEAEWFKADSYNYNVSLDANTFKLTYVPINVLESGNSKFRVEVSANGITDIVEKEAEVSPDGYKVEKVVSSGNLDGDISEDILILDDFIENTASAKVKIYKNTMIQNIEGMENIFHMPTGCFEQISSTLYPNILALKYLEDNKIVDETLKEKALEYISTGYQKLLTYEVKGEKGGYSLYGNSPAETVLTAYGLMEITDLKEVYDIDENVIVNMTEFLYRKQNLNGEFTITGNHVGGASSREKLALNAYIIWALSESNPKEKRLEKSVQYLKDNLENVDDNYTLALIANTLANVKDKEVQKVVNALIEKINLSEGYVSSKIRDYYGSSNTTQTIQTTALTSMALSKTSSDSSANKILLNYLIKMKDARGTWYSTQATILALKAINEVNNQNQIGNQTVNVKINSEEKNIEVKENSLELYEVTFDNLQKENKLSIDLEKGNCYYEVVEEYYIPYDKVDVDNNKIDVEVQTNGDVKVDELLNAKIKLVNRSGEDIYNGMVTISIPQGFTVYEEDLMKLENDRIIEKYDMTYREVNIYLRNFERDEVIDLSVGFRALYPVEIKGLAVRVYDYYNPEISGVSLPILVKSK